MRNDGGSDGYEGLVSRHIQAPFIDLYILHIFLPRTELLVKRMRNRNGLRFYVEILL